LGNQVFRLAEEEKKKKRSEISGRDLQKPFWEFKTINSLQDEQMLSYHIEISITDILTLPHDAVFGHLQKADIK
jgi:hypothetical protein